MTTTSNTPEDKNKLPELPPPLPSEESEDEPLSEKIKDVVDHVDIDVDDEKIGIKIDI